MRQTQTLAVVIPIFNESENLPELGRRLAAALDGIADLDWRVIYVDDGSRDDSRTLILEQHQRDGRFCLLELSRNFGHEAAISAGVDAADADAVVIMDGDLQDAPELIPAMVASWRAGGEVVRAQRKSRAEHGVRRLGFELFHMLFRFISDAPIPAHSGVFGLLDRRAVEVIRRMPERNRFFPGIRWYVGFEQRWVDYDRSDRAAGAPKQSMRRLIHYAADAVFSFSYRPLKLLTSFGLMVALCGFVLALFFVIHRLIGAEQAPTGFTTLVSLVLFLGGVQLVGLGIIGEYIGRIYDEAKQRPAYVVRRGVGVGDENKTPPPGRTGQ